MSFRAKSRNLYDPSPTRSLIIRDASTPLAMTKGVNLAILIVLLSIRQGTGQETPGPGSFPDLSPAARTASPSSASSMTPTPFPILTPAIGLTASPTPAPSLTPEETPSAFTDPFPTPSVTPEESALAFTTAVPTRSMSGSAFFRRRWKARSVSEFTTPAGKLVRVLHREAEAG